MVNSDLGLLRCPRCRGGLTSGERLACRECGLTFPEIDGLRRLYVESDVRRSDRFLRAIYDRVPPVLDSAARLMLAYFDRGRTETLRDRFMRRVEIGALRPHPGGRPVRILEVGIGTGDNVAILRRDLPGDVPAEIWGVDLSVGLLQQCRRRVPADVRLLVADAHALPFPDASFDRVYHIGGVNGFGDPARALAELARVAVPGTPIVVVDEQLDPALANHRIMGAAFRVYTFYADSTGCPTHLLPAAARDVREEQVNAFHYCLTFRMPEAAA
jgi:ubiquinone/menaquinone biosynthesis C-methylase UbiE